VTEKTESHVHLPVDDAADASRAKNRRDLAGQRFGKLTAQMYIGGGRWHCICDCGGTSEATTTHLRSGNSTTCGCSQKKQMPRKNPDGERTPTYNTWRNMKSRCKPASKAHPHYAKNNISLCERWRSSFESFVADMGERPAGKTLDRIDNAKGYEPGNCRWATWEEQNTNRSRTRWIVAFGERKTLAQWSRFSGVSSTVICHRLARGISTERAITRECI
jgi:hypothetical protein